MRRPGFSTATLFALIALPAVAIAATPTLTLDVWPGTPPGETKLLPPEADQTKETDRLIAGRRIIKLGNVSRPQLAVFRPAKEKDTGAAVVICPGGGFNILAYDLEGTEVAEWLNGLGVTGIVLNSSVIHSPQEAPQQLAEQEQWLRAELTKAKAAGTPHIVVFQHHPWFITTASEPDQYFNIPLARRAAYMALFREFGVKYLFCGHYHRNAEGRDGDIQNITSGPVGKPLGGAKSGLRVAIVRDAGIEHRYYELGELPVNVELTPPAPKKK